MRAAKSAYAMPVMRAASFADAPFHTPCAIAALDLRQRATLLLLRWR